MTARHRPVSPRTKRSSKGYYALVAFAVFVVGIVTVTLINGELRLPFGGGVLFAFERDEAPEKPSNELPEGTVAVLASPVALPAYTRITREHLLNAEGFHTVPVVEDAIEANGLFPSNVKGVQAILGRVLKRSKSVNFAFTENDFLPKGTRSGLSAGIPPGERGVWVDMEQVGGLTDVRAGDRVDLIAAERVKTKDVNPSTVVGDIVDPVLAARLNRASSGATGQSQARSWVIAREALVVKPLRRRERKPGARKPGQPADEVEEVFLALKPAEVASLSQAYALDVTIFGSPRSGQPETVKTEIEDVSPPDPVAELRRMLLDGDDATPIGSVEIIEGNQRRRITVPRGRKVEGR